MSNLAQRREKMLERRAQQKNDETERRRLAALRMYDRIEFSDASEEVKYILHHLAQVIGEE